jgi:hypothetical protein
MEVSKFSRRHWFLPPWCALVISAGLAMAAPVQFESLPLGNQVKVSGTFADQNRNSIGKWLLEGVAVIGSLEAEREQLSNGRFKPESVKLVTRVPVRSLSGLPPSTLEWLRGYLRAHEHPAVIFTLKELKVTARPADGPVAAKMKGNLVLAGVTNEVTVPVTIAKTGADTLKIMGGFDLELSAFGTLPTGLIWTRSGPRNEDRIPVPPPKSGVKVEFTWCLREKPAE